MMMAIMGHLKLKVFFTVIVLINLVEVISSCNSDQFRCFNGRCINRYWYCDGANDCGDNSDEMYCREIPDDGCPVDGIRWLNCRSMDRCYPAVFRCDGINQCHDGSDESGCIHLVSGVEEAREKLTRRFVDITHSRQSSDKWSELMLKATVALHLSDPNFFSPRSATGELLSYGLSLYLLARQSLNMTFTTEELSWFINALLVTCVNPRDFYGVNFVQELRTRVDNSSGYINPFTILSLCNAGDDMTNADRSKVLTAFHAHHRPLWTDTQAVATMAMACIVNNRNDTWNDTTMNDMVDELKSKQHPNGTVYDLKTTALVVQALKATENYEYSFDLEAAMNYLVKSADNVTINDANYILPIFNSETLANINSYFCLDPERKDLDVVKNMKEGKNKLKHIQAQLSVAIGNDMDFIRSWRLKVPETYNCYQLLELFGSLASEFKPEYIVSKGKPYVRKIGNFADDALSGKFWFTYLQTLESASEPVVTNKSPVDIQVDEKVELILWYRSETWNESAKLATLRTNRIHHELS